jgi:hypothetical protein
MESTLKSNVILHNKMYMNHIIGFVSFVTPSVEWKQRGLAGIDFLRDSHISLD